MKHKILLLFIVVFGCLLRIFYCLYQTPDITTNVSYWGLIARDIASFNYFPFWRYGSSSVGSVFSYLVAFTSPVLGINIFSLAFIELMFSIMFILSMYFAGKTLFGKRGGVIVALLVSFAPASLIKSSVLPTGVYNIILFFGSIMLLLATKIWEGNLKKVYLYYVLGLIGGVSFWINIYSICFLIPCIVFIISGSRLKTKAWCILIISFLIGGIPFWLSNFKNGFLTFSNFVPKPIEDILFYDAGDVLSMQLKNVLGSKSITLGLIYFAGFIYFCYRLNGKLFKSKETLILIFIVFSVAVISKYRIIPSLDLHPSIFLYAGFPYVVAYLLINIMKKSKIIFSMALFFIIILQLCNTAISAVNGRKRNIVKNKALSQLITQLRSNNIHYLYTTPGIVPIINFLTKGNIVADYYDKFNCFPYSFITCVNEQPAVVLPLVKARKFMKNLKYICRDYKKIANSQYALFFSFKKSAEEQIEVSPYNWDALSSYNRYEVKLAFDRDAGTRWTTHMKQMPDMYFQLDLKKETLIDKIVVYLGKDISDRASGLEIKVSNDNKNWKRVVYLKDNKNTLFWSGPYLFWKNYTDRQEYCFKPIRARYIRFNQLGYTDEKYWSITELFVYGPSFESPRISYDIAKLDSFLKQKRLNNLYADYWMNERGEVSKNIDLSSSPAIITDSSFRGEDMLIGHGIDFKKDIVDGLFVYYSLKSKNPLLLLDKKDWVGSSNIQSYSTEKAFDNNLITRWSTEKVQSPGYYFQIDLKEEKYISGIRFWHSGSPNDWPRDIRIEFLDNDFKWKTLEYKKDFSGSLYWTGFGILVDSSQYYTYVFNHIKTKAVRCILTESNNKYYWSIHEVDLII